MLIFIATISDERIRNKFEQIYFEYSRYLYVIGFIILRDKESIEDAMQQSFIKIFNNIDKINIIQSKQTKSFISVIMRNEAINSAIRTVTMKVKSNYSFWAQDTTPINSWNSTTQVLY